MDTVLADFAAFRKSLFTEPAQDTAWQSQRLQYDFALGSPVPNDNLLLNAPDFPEDISTGTPSTCRQPRQIRFRRQTRPKSRR
jgi:hypothetical protein